MDPRDVEIILSSHVYLDKSAEYKFFKPWLGNGLLISTGEYCVFFSTHNSRHASPLLREEKMRRDEIDISSLCDIHEYPKFTHNVISVY